MSWSEISKYADHTSRGVLLLEHSLTLGDQDYWHAVRDAWQDSDRQPLSAAQWRTLWCADRPGRENVMDAGERDRLAALPDRVEVHRGVNARNTVSGLSWTLDADTAHWFADIPGAGSLRVEARLLIAVLPPGRMKSSGRQAREGTLPAPDRAPTDHRPRSGQVHVITSDAVRDHTYWIARNEPMPTEFRNPLNALPAAPGPWPRQRLGLSPPDGPGFFFSTRRT